MATKKAKPKTKPFSELTQPERLLAVAKDVLFQLYRAESPLRVAAGTYIKADDPLHLDPNDELQKHVEDVQKLCTVCALGSLILSKSRVFDSQKVDNLIHWDQSEGYRNSAGRSNIIESLSEICDRSQCDEIEACFEVTSMYAIQESSRVYGAVKFGAGFTDDTKRLRAIMGNIIKNGGVFEAGEATEEECDQAKTIYYTYL